MKRESSADARSKKKGGKAKRSEAPLDLRLIIFALAIMIIFVIGVAQVVAPQVKEYGIEGIESFIPLAVIVAIFFVWWHAANEKRADREKPLRKTLAILLIMVFVFYPFPLNAVAKPFPSTTNLPLSAAYAINTAERGIGMIGEADW
ncbi:MAG: hypothetical protein QMD22_11685, partial [archaeon]|nr:hypothetical protein [archaeon]